MILSCDPPRHAFLIHFGSRQQSDAIEVIREQFGGAKLEIALNRRPSQPCLVALHFVRHGFWLPFVGAPPNEFSINNFNLRYGRRQNRYFFCFNYHGDNAFHEWKAYPGITVLMSEAPQYRSKERPVLHGVEVDPEVLAMDVDMSEFEFELGADHLKDVNATLFVKRQ